MFFVLVAIIILGLCAIFSALLNDESKRVAVACVGTSLGSLIGLLALLTPSRHIQKEILFSTSVPNVSFAFGIDPLSMFFLVVIFAVSLLAGLYGYGYLRSQKRLANSVPFFPLLVAAMAGVVISKDGFSFLVIWEIMSLVSFFLVTSEHEDKDVQNAGWTYLIATHLATAFLMAFFVIMAKSSGSLMFKDFVAVRALSPFLAGLLFIFAVVGFGTKAGIFPFHIWLPRAHPAAPSYVSAIMSGVMIKTGIYGILRALTFLGSPPLWWGVLLIVVGVVSAVMGVLYALMQHDLKKLLAYHSVENIGIIVVGIGIGLVGVSEENVLVATLGFGGAIFHVLNHALFKSLLFLSAGSIAHATHTLSIDRMGGLLKRLPATGAIFLVAAMSICGLPPFNGFVSEWLVYMGLFNGSILFSGYPILLSAAGVLGIAFAGGLAVLCFTKVFGVVFLGEGRTDYSEDCHDPSSFLVVPMGVLAAACLLVGLFPGLVWPFVLSAVCSVFPNSASADVSTIMSSLNWISVIFALLIVIAVLFLLVRKITFRKKEIASAVTWDCGYAHPTSKMQYTAAGFAEPVGTFFKAVLDPSNAGQKASGVFPKQAVFEEHIDDFAERNFFGPLFSKIGSVILFIRNRKKSTVQSYLALIFITLITFFVLEVWFGI